MIQNSLISKIDVLNFYISRRISTEDTVDDISTVYYQNERYWPPQFCNESNITLNVNSLNSYISLTGDTITVKASIPIFKLVCNHDVTEDVNIHLEWGEVSKKLLLTYLEKD